MKIPSDETPQNHTNGDGYISDDYEQLEMAPAPIRDGDFSEYMWMENEEEFNTQVLRELEEQELMEECMAAMLGESAPNEGNESQNAESNHANNSRTSNDSFNTSFNGLSDSVNNLSLSSNGVRNNSSDSFNNSHSQSSSNTQSHFSVQSRLNRQRPMDNSRSNTSNSATENGSKSTLNPDAKEFVPSSPRAVTSLSNAGEEKVPS